MNTISGRIDFLYIADFYLESISDTGLSYDASKHTVTPNLFRSVHMVYIYINV